MKIVHVMNWFIPNMGYQENFLPHMQKKLGFDVDIICSDKIPHSVGYKEIFDGKTFKTGSTRDNGVNVIRLNSIHLKNEFIILKNLKNVIKKLKPDIIHAHGLYVFSTLQLLKWQKELKYKLFIDDHSNENNLFFYHIPLFKFLKIFYRFYSDRVSKFLPVTKSAEINLLNIWGINKEKIELIDLGVNDRLFKNSTALRNSIRANFSLNDEFLIISSGKFGKRKDVLILIEAFNIINKNHNNFRLLLLGNGPDKYMDQIKKMIYSYNLQENVFFVDFIENIKLPAFYNASDIGVWPGTHSITVIEAVATGLPVIIPEKIEAYSILTRNNAVITFSRGDINQLAEKILLLAKNKSVRDKIILNAEKVINNNLSWDKIAEKTISIYIGE